ncbi:hypothetical protein V8G54_002875, partial [Vigna mungo]
HFGSDVLRTGTINSFYALKKKLILALHIRRSLFLCLHGNHNITSRSRHDNSSVRTNTILLRIGCFHLEGDIGIGLIRQLKRTRDLLLQFKGELEFERFDVEELPTAHVGDGSTEPRRREIRIPITHTHTGKRFCSPFSIFFVVEKVAVSKCVQT